MDDISGDSDASIGDFDPDDLSNDRVFDAGASPSAQSNGNGNGDGSRRRPPPPQWPRVDPEPPIDPGLGTSVAGGSRPLPSAAAAAEAAALADPLDDPFVAPSIRGVEERIPGARERRRSANAPSPVQILVVILLAGASAFVLNQLLNSGGDDPDGVAVDSQTVAPVAGGSASDAESAEAADDGTGSLAAGSADDAGVPTSDPDWPGGTGPVPDGPPVVRLATLTPDGNITLTGSAPNWVTATRIVQFAGEKLPGGPDVVDNQLAWHPEASESTQWGDVQLASAAIFPTSSIELEPSSLAGLDLIAEILVANPTVFAVVVGHADTSGVEEINVQLAADRAAVVVDYLVGEGAVVGQLVIASSGSDVAIADNDTEEGRAENRRVDISLKNFLIPSLEGGQP